MAILQAGYQTGQFNSGRFAAPKQKQRGRYKCDVGRLGRAVQTSRMILERYRSERREIVRQFVGAHYSEDGAQKKVPLNLISMYMQIVSRTLISKEPRVMLSSLSKEAGKILSIMEPWCNERIEEIGLAETLQRAVMDAMISVGIVKTALASPGEAALSN